MSYFSPEFQKLRTEVERRGIQVMNLHSRFACQGRGCVVHHPSAHHMRKMPLLWRTDRNIMERMCPHGVGHPDPDSAAYLTSIGREFESQHGCDGCCAPTTDKEPNDQPGEDIPGDARTDSEDGD